MICKKNILPVALSLLMLLGLDMLALASDRTQNIEPSLGREAFQEISSASDRNTLIDRRVIARNFEDIREQLIQDYEGIYALNNFSYDHRLRNENGVMYIDLDIHATMTLIRPPSESPFLQGLQEVLSATSCPSQAVAVQKEFDFYKKIIEFYYLMPQDVTFTYSFTVGGIYSNVFYRYDLGDETMLIDADALAEIEEPDVAKQEGYVTGLSAANRNSAQMLTASPASSWRYDRIAARDWAYNNALAIPEYPSPTIPDGSNCANFVSKAINAGGIPEDRPGRWHRSSTWGGWAGDNWMRTGFHNNGGVVPYMTGRGFFFHESNESRVIAGSIMYWTTRSHVAFVTRGDTVNILYAQHSPGGRNLVYRDASGVRISGIRFYAPSQSIM